MIDFSLAEIRDLIEYVREQKIQWSRIFDMRTHRNKWSRDGRLNLILDKLLLEQQKISDSMKEHLKGE